METIEQKELKVKEKIASAKRTIAKKSKPKPAEASPISGDVKPPEQEKPKKKAPKKPQSPQEWLQGYTKNQLSTSSAVQVTILLSRSNGATLSECCELATSIGSMKGSAWGQSKASIKQHLKFLASKSLVCEDLGDERYKVLAP